MQIRINVLRLTYVLVKNKSMWLFALMLGFLDVQSTLPKFCKEKLTKERLSRGLLISSFSFYL